ncbi:MAG: phosphoribosyltransferase family protein [Candidatus Pacebacteria bacterium]|nr:phosphoribosyltransferase family protein [Candidatus Paceibacterota bacterium]
MDTVLFENRVDAAKQLAKQLKHYQETNSVVLGIPRGGVETAQVIAKELSLPMGLVVVRKIGHPYTKEYAIGAISESGAIVENKEETKGLNPDWLKAESQNQLNEAKRRRIAYWKNRPLLNLEKKTAILVDDGLATGLTMEVAIKELKKRNPAKIIVAVPVSPQDTAQRLKKEVDNFISLLTPQDYLGSVGAYYKKFSQIEDEEVIKMINDNPNETIP